MITSFRVTVGLLALIALVTLGASSVYAGVWNGYAPFTVGSASSTAPFLTVTAQGKVGLGDTAPVSALSIKSTDPTLRLAKTPNGQVWNVGISGGTAYTSAFSITNANANRQVLTLDTNGNVSIGTSTTALNSRLYVWGGPTGANVDVRGDTNIVGGDQATIELEGGDYDTMPNSALIQYYGAKAIGNTMGFPNKRLGVIQFSNANAGLILTAGTAAPLVFGTDYAERVRITGDGKLGVGTADPKTILHVSSGANATTTISVGELNTPTSKSCVNMNRADGGPASFYVNGAGALVVEKSYCK